MKAAVENLEEAQEEVKGLGETLREKRQSLGLDIDDIAKKLHLKPSLISDIESEQYDPALSVTFTKGYIRLYAKHLGLEPEEVLALFDTHVTLEKHPTKLKSFSQKVAKQASDARLMMVTYVIIAVVIGLLIMWWVQQSSESPSTAQEYMQDTGRSEPLNVERRAAVVVEEQTSVSEPDDTAIQADNTLIAQAVSESVANVAEQPVTEEPVPTRMPNGDEVVEAMDEVSNEVQASSTARDGSSENFNTAIAEVLEAPQDGSFTEDSSIQETIVGNAAIADTAEASADIADDFASTEPQRLQLVFEFSGDCWMNLTDATGEVVAYGVKPSGYVMPVSGVPPFEVVLGAPSVVSITVDGEAFDMSDFPAGRTARFMIGEEE